MANTLTDLIPDAYAALDVVSRELSGGLLAFARDSRADRAALNQNVRSFVTRANAAGADYTPAMSVPAAANQTVDNVAITIAKNRYWPFSWTGEEEYAMDAGPGALTIQQDQIAQAIRQAVNEMESWALTMAYKESSRAYGTAGTAPFGNAGDWSDSAQLRKILDDNGAPPSDRHLIIDTAAGANIRAKQGQVQMYGSDQLARQGVLLDSNGFMIRESAGVPYHTKGTGASYVVNNGNVAVGSTVLSMDGGTGTIIAGDVLTNSQSGRDTNKYIVRVALAAGDLTINQNGLRVLWVDGDTLVVGNSYRANLGFSRNAILLATRLPAMPRRGDLSTAQEVITDPRTGLSFEIRYYPGDGMGLYRLHACWGGAVLKPEHIATLLG